jgi:hypothetical protein
MNHADQPVQGRAQITVSQNSVVGINAWMDVIVLWEQFYKMDAATNWKNAHVNTIKFGIKHSQKYQWTVMIGKSAHYSLFFSILNIVLLIRIQTNTCI